MPGGGEFQAYGLGVDLAALFAALAEARQDDATPRPGPPVPEDDEEEP